MRSFANPVLWRIACAGFLTLVFGIPQTMAQRRQLETAETLRSRVLKTDRLEEGSVEDDREEAEAAEEADETPFGVNLRSLQLVSHQDNISTAADPGENPIVIASDLPAPPSLSSILMPFVEEPLSMALLSRIQKEIIVAWRESDYPLVDVYFPEQNITGGRLQIVVREARLGEKTVEGAIVSRKDYLVGQLRPEPGGRISRRVVESDLDWLNENPIRQVDLIYERGEEDGTSDILLNVTEEKAFSAYTGFANTGVSLTGEEEWSFGFNLANPFQREQMFGYHFATDLEWDHLQAHSVFYQAFLPWRHTFRIVGAYVTSDSDVVPLLSLEGESKQLTTEYRIPLMRPEFNRQWRHSLTFAFDYKSTNTDLIFGGSGLFGTTVSVGQFRGAYEVRVPDKYGITRFSTGVVGSPGDLFTDNNDVSFAATRAGTEASYAYGFAEVERLFRLPEDFTLRVEMSGQASSDRLTATEQVLAGGYDSVRGFNESVVRGDSGFLSSIELISPDFSVGDRLGQTLQDTWNAFLFYDAAALSISDPLPGEVSPSLQGAGIGLNCRFSDRGFARASYGWALDSRGVAPADETGGKFHFGITLTY